MTAWFDKLNLQPQERRMVLVALVVVALLLNYWLVWPYFRQYGAVGQGLEETRRVRDRYSAETSKTNGYVRRLRELQTQGGQIASDDAANQLQQIVNREAATAGVQINSIIPSTVSSRSAGGMTNQFFDDIQVSLSLSAGETELVNFLYALGAGDSMIRVRDVSNLRLETSQTRLQATLTLVASVPKKAASAPARAASSRAANTNRPPK